MLLLEPPPPIHPTSALQNATPRVTYPPATNIKPTPKHNTNPTHLPSTINAILAKRLHCTNERETSWRRISSREPAQLKERHQENWHPNTINFVVVDEEKSDEKPSSPRPLVDRATPTPKEPGTTSTPKGRDPPKKQY
jgi:hypothetical protein